MDVLPAGLRVVSLAERPDLAPALDGLHNSWPAFMLEDPASWMLSLLGPFADFQLALLDGDRPVARAHSVPFPWDGDEASLPDTGWDTVLARGVVAPARGRDADGGERAGDLDHPGVAGQGAQPGAGRRVAGGRRRRRLP